MNNTLKKFHIMMAEQYPMFEKSIPRAYEKYGEAWETEFLNHLTTMFGDDSDGWAEAIQGYVLFSLDAIRNQTSYETTGRYEASNYDEIKSDYWDNSDHMLTNYMPGMYISYFLWPHHYELLMKYREEICSILRDDGRIQSFCEVGVGTGIYSQSTLNALPVAQGIGYDISQYSLEFCNRGMKAFHLTDRYKVKQQDILKNTPPPVDYLICQEVLEHLEDPMRFCEGLYRMVRPGGKAFITAAITAGHSDHIYLYETPDEVQEQIEKAGFSIVMSYTKGADVYNKIQPRVSCFFCERE